MKTRNRILCVILALMLCVGMLPISILMASATVHTGTCGEQGNNVTWSYDDSTQTLTVSGTGAMADYSYDTPGPWNAYRDSITSVVVGNGVTSVGAFTFNNCSSLETVMLSNDVAVIKYGAFVGCDSLTTVTMPRVTEIGASAFYLCKLLQSVQMPEVITIGEKAFMDCEKLKSVNISKAETIASQAFQHCPSLEKITIPATVTNIGHSAFYACTSLATVNMLGNAPSLDKFVFSNTNANLKIYIPANATGYDSGEWATWASIIIASIKTPTIDTKPTASRVVVGSKLSDSTLTGGMASVTGKFAWKDGAEVLDTAETVTKKVVFTPDDTDNYNTVEIDVNVMVVVCDTASGEHNYTELKHDDIDHWYECAKCGNIKADSKIEHAFEWKIDKEPTASKTGLKHEECSCGAKRNIDTIIPKTETNSPQTGDSGNLLFWIALLFISGMTIAATCIYGRKKRQAR